LLLQRFFEPLAKETPGWYAGMRARVEAKAALKQAEELRRVLGDLRKRLGGDRCKKASAKPPSPSTIRA
jgi:hypothetical protein